LLAYLLVHAGAPQPLDRIVDAVWPGAESAGPAATVRTYVSHFRRAFRTDGEVRLLYRAGGYALDLPQDALDASRFEEAVGAASTEGESGARLALLDHALAIWRGPPLDEFAGHSWADDRIHHWTRLHVRAQALKAASLLDAGRHRDALSMLEPLVGMHPLHEPFWEQLVLARYRCGQQADALAAISEARHTLARELGVDPGPGLVELEQQVLAHDPSLAGSAGQRLTSPRTALGTDGDPGGVVTFLLTDIESSTQLWDEHPGAMTKALVRHEDLIGEVVHGHAGRVLKSRGEGDSSLSVFARATDAVSAAIGIQRRLQLEVWPESIVLKTRVAVHAGEAVSRDGDYFGGTLNRAARIRGLAAGGEILLSRAAHDLVADLLPDDVVLVDLGDHAMRGLRRRETVYLVEAPGLAASGTASVGETLTDRTSLIGREPELGQILDALTEPGVVTITGPGGIGKTRLMHEVLARVNRDEQRFTRLWTVELAGVAGQVGIESALHAAIVRQTENTRRPAHGTDTQDLISNVARTLGSRREIVALDNCEHVLDSLERIIGPLTARCPRLSVLATSRQPLALPRERVIALSPLGIPDADAHTHIDQLERVESIRLLLDRTQDAGGDLRVTPSTAASLAQLCRQLDGIPLALELAAARLCSTTPHDLAVRLDRRLDLLKSTRGDPRHRTLYGAIEWSYQLLEAAEKVLLRRLGVFVHGFTLDAAEEVCSDPEPGPLASENAVYVNLAELVSKSLVVFDRDAGRYRLLEPIRFFAREHLAAAGETAAVARRHADWVLSRSRSLLGPQLGGETAIEGAFSAELDNVQAALDWLRDVGDNGTYMRIVASLGYTWFHTDWRRGRVAAERAVEMAAGASPRLRAAIFLSRGLVEHHANYDASAPWLREARAIYSEIGDQVGVAWATYFLGRVRLLYAGDDQAEPLMQEALSLFRSMNHPHAVADCLASLGLRAKQREDLEAAREYFEEALAIATSTGQETMRGLMLGELGCYAHVRGEVEDARALLSAAIDLQRSGGDRWNLAGQLVTAAWVEMTAGDLGAALELATEALESGIEIDDEWQLREALLILALIRFRQGDPREARRLIAATGWDVAPPEHHTYIARAAVTQALTELSPILDGLHYEAHKGRMLGVAPAARAFVAARRAPSDAVRRPHARSRS
jgi:predicted ATPase/class 3 adenylate cyclase